MPTPLPALDDRTCQWPKPKPALLFGSEPSVGRDNQPDQCACICCAVIPHHNTLGLSRLGCFKDDFCHIFLHPNWLKGLSNHCQRSRLFIARQHPTFSPSQKPPCQRNVLYSILKNCQFVRKHLYFGFVFFKCLAERFFGFIPYDIRNNGHLNAFTYRGFFLEGNRRAFHFGLLSAGIWQPFPSLAAASATMKKKKSEHPKHNKNQWTHRDNEQRFLLF